MRKTWNRWKNRERRDLKQLKTVIALIFILIIGSSAYASFRYFQDKKYKEISLENAPLKINLEESLDPNSLREEDRNQLAVLLLGYGGAGHQGAYLTDVMQIVYFDFEAKRITFISVPRDLEVSLSDGSSRKINSVLSSALSGGNDFTQAAQQVKNVLSQITAIPIKYFVAIDFVGFQRTIGYELKGIEVDVKQTFSDPWYPIEGEQLNPCGHSPEEIAQITQQNSGFELEKQFACRYEKLYFPQGTVGMEGGEALKYVRSRHSSSDFDRSRRQREVLLAIREKLFQLEVLADIPKYYQAFDQHVETDINLEIAKYIAPLFIHTDEFTVAAITLSTENVLLSQKNNAGAFVLVPNLGHNNWQGVQAFIQGELENAQTEEKL